MDVKLYVKIINEYIADLIIYDYLFFGVAFVLFILLVLISAMLYRKIILSILIMTLAVSLFIVTPTAGILVFHKFLYSNTVTIDSVKKLEYSQALLIKGTLKNTSKLSFKRCRVTVNAFKVTGNAIKDLIYPYKPFKHSSTLLKDTIIAKKESINYRILMEPFTYSKEYNLSVKASCK
ncbi:MAG: DUF2393 domain-containing protein [Helicobacteraceae bacterium]|nr:DUF2393 domain-containing protein [Helicobacteraceae bacterium]